MFVQFLVSKQVNDIVMDVMDTSTQYSSTEPNAKMPENPQNHENKRAWGCWELGVLPCMGAGASPPGASRPPIKKCKEKPPRITSAEASFLHSHRCNFGKVEKKVKAIGAKAKKPSFDTDSESSSNSDTYPMIMDQQESTTQMANPIPAPSLRRFRIDCGFSINKRILPIISLGRGQVIIGFFCPDSD